MLENLMMHTATVQSPVLVKDASGVEHPASWENVYENLPCFVQPISPAEQQFYNERGMEVTHHIYTNQIQEYGYNWRLLYNGSYYYVEGVKNLAELNVAVQLQCRTWPSDAKRR